MPFPPSTFRFLLGAVTAGWLGLSLGAAQEGAVSLEKHIKPLLQEYCFDCHNEEKAKGDLNLAGFADNPKLFEHRDIWEKVVEALEAGDMPPEKKPQLTMAQRDQVVRFIDGQLAKFDCKTERNPGRVTIRRLNKLEYQNTVRELLAVDYRPEDFPNDEVGYGFDNIADVLSLSPMLMEKFMGAAEAIALKAILVPETMAGGWHRLGPQTLHRSGDGVRWQEDQKLTFASNGEVVAKLQIDQPGEYRLRFKAHADKAGKEAARLRIRIGDREVRILDIKARRDNPELCEVKFAAEGGLQELGLAFINDGAGDEGDRNVYVRSLEVEGRLAVQPAEYPESHRRLLAKLPEPGKEAAAAREVLAPLLRRAYRRVVTPAEVERVAAFVDSTIREKGTYAEGMQTAVQAILCSPHFLFRWENDPEVLAPGQSRDLTDWELASRLSYFLWSSMPDDQLFELAAKGALRKEGNLEKEIARMIGDWRSGAFVENFAGQWLQIRNIWDSYVDTGTFPRWSDDLKGLMKEETELFFKAVMQENLPVGDLLDAKFTFLNEKLAKYYGVDGVKGPNFQRVALPENSPRGGVLTMGSVLVATSTPTRTSPVIRGKWILEQLLGTEPPPPPADVPPLAEVKTIDQTASLRQRFELHRSNAECASCHAKMDPLGFALENFDAAGAWRDKDGNHPIDSSGKMAGGIKFAGARDLKAVVKADKRFVHCLAEKMLTYALGRGLEYYDRCAVDDIVARAAKQENRFAALITAIVFSDPFIKRKNDGAPLARNQP